MSEPVRKLTVVWFCAKCSQPVTTWYGGAAWCCPSCHAMGPWAGDRIEVPKYALVVGDERLES